MTSHARRSSLVEISVHKQRRFDHSKINISSDKDNISHEEDNILTPRIKNINNFLLTKSNKSTRGKSNGIDTSGDFTNIVLSDNDEISSKNNSLNLEIKSNVFEKISSIISPRKCNSDSLLTLFSPRKIMLDDIISDSKTDNSYNDNSFDSSESSEYESEYESDESESSEEDSYNRDKNVNKDTYINPKNIYDHKIDITSQKYIDIINKSKEILKTPLGTDISSSAYQDGLFCRKMGLSSGLSSLFNFEYFLDTVYRSHLILNINTKIYLDDTHRINFPVLSPSQYGILKDILSRPGLEEYQYLITLQMLLKMHSSFCYYDPTISDFDWFDKPKKTNNLNISKIYSIPIFQYLILINRSVIRVFSDGEVEISSHPKKYNESSNSGWSRFYNDNGYFYSRGTHFAVIPRGSEYETKMLPLAICKYKDSKTNSEFEYPGILYEPVLLTDPLTPNEMMTLFLDGKYTTMDLDKIFRHEIGHGVYGLPHSMNRDVTMSSNESFMAEHNQPEDIKRAQKKAGKSKLLPKWRKLIKKWFHI